MKSRKLYVVAVLLLVAGLATFFIGFGMMDFDAKNFDSEPPYIGRTYTPEGKTESIIVSDTAASVNITASADNKIHIRYYDNVNEQYAITDEGGTIEISKETVTGFFENFLTLSQSNPALFIELPQKYEGSITVNNADANLTASDVSLKSITADISGGNIRLSNLKVSGQTDIKCSGGEIRAYDIESKKNCKLYSKNGDLFAWNITTGKLYSTAQNGLMTLAYINADSVFANSDKRDIKISCLSFRNDAHLLSQSGNITGTVMGYETDFTFLCSAPEGTCNLSETASQGAKNLHITTNEGNIEISLNEPTE